MAIATLKRRAEFLRLRGGRRWSTPAFVIEMRPRAGSDQPMRNEGAQGRETLDTYAPEAAGEARFGFTATKKLGNAVTRNRLRRRIKEAVRLVAPVHARAGCDYVLIVRSAAETRPFTAIEQDLIAAFAAIHAPSGRNPKAPSGAAQRTSRATPRNVSTAGRT
jgi:ribonuclease P protein component